MNSNYALSSHHVIEQLQQLLQDYYPLGPDGRTFLKELIQNADDAGAATLRFFVFEYGYPDADNSLLRGPALLYINDGPFGEDDERGLRSFVGGSKSADDEKVGRFGLGQKVVFHFCEAWCYLGRGPASAGREGVDRLPLEERARVINPWSGTGRGPGDPQHPDWDELTPADRERLRVAVEPKAGGASFLAVWLPLRRKGHRRKSGAALTELEPSTADVLERLCNEEQVARLLSACRSLSSIEVRSSPNPTAEGERRLLACREQGVYLGRYNSTALARERELDGVVEVSSLGGTRRWTVTGLEVLSSHPQVLAELRSDSWPLRNVWTREDGDAIRERVKAAPHAAFTRSRRESGAWPRPRRRSMGSVLPGGRPGVRAGFAPGRRVSRDLRARLLLAAQ